MLSYKTPARLAADNAEADRIMKASDPVGKRNEPLHHSRNMSIGSHETPEQFRRRAGDKTQG